MTVVTPFVPFCEFCGQSRADGVFKIAAYDYDPRGNIVTVRMPRHALCSACWHHEGPWGWRTVTFVNTDYAAYLADAAARAERVA